MVVIHATQERIESYNRFMVNEWLKDHEDIVGIVLRSYKYGKFKVIECAGKANISSDRMYNILFIDTSYILRCTKASIIRGRVKDHTEDLYVGKIMKNKKGQDFEIISNPAPGKYDIRFLDSGYVSRNVDHSGIKDGWVKDHTNDLYVGKIMKNNKGEDFEIISKSSSGTCDIKFLASGYVSRNIANSGIRKGRVKDHTEDLYIGKIMKNKKGEDFEIISKPTPGKRDIKFLASGYISRNVKCANIRAGYVKDPYSINAYHFSIGFTNDERRDLIEKDEDLYHSLYARCASMNRRCYSKIDNAYHAYGALGITVCDSWKSFNNYFYDVQKLPGFDRDKVVSGELELDKDEYYLSKGITDKSQYQYSPETCQWITFHNNNSLVMKRKYKEV